MSLRCTCSYATGYTRALYVEAGDTKFCSLHLPGVATAIAAAKAEGAKEATAAIVAWLDRLRMPPPIRWYSAIEVLSWIAGQIRDGVHLKPEVGK